jgi:hypothetical protein
MAPPQLRTFPRNSTKDSTGIKDSTGMLSRAASSVPHDGQADGGATIESFRGTR